MTGGELLAEFSLVQLAHRVMCFLFTLALVAIHLYYVQSSRLILL